ncbi:MAG: hypothetical protein J6V72_21825 [Kiritimatiellae bacterium]|nr:hypothetical protein [Kiritimatiellia bacterium]
MLSERAADWMRAQMNAGYTGEADPARLRARDGSLPLPLPVHFELTRKVEEGVAVWRVGEGAVQDGQTTIWFEGDEVDITGIGEEIVYASLSASESEGAGKEVTVGVVAGVEAFNALQTDGGPTVWPLYHLTDGLIDMDYRPIFSVGSAPAPEPTASIPGPFEPVYTSGVLSGLAHCVFCAERQFVDCGTMALSGITAQSTGCVVLTLTHPARADALFAVANASVAFLTNGLPQPNTGYSETVIPLYHITNGVVDVDLRAVPTGVLAR